MRCLSCNVVLSDFEATRKFADSGEYLDLCNTCSDSSDLSGLDILVRPDLMKEEPIESDDDYSIDEGDFDAT